MSDEERKIQYLKLLLGAWGIMFTWVWLYLIYKKLQDLLMALTVKYGLPMVL